VHVEARLFEFLTALVGLSLAFFYIWMLVISGVLLLVAIGGLVFEYHLRPSDH
jgi:hypothetical protein